MGAFVKAALGTRASPQKGSKHCERRSAVIRPGAGVFMFFLYRRTRSFVRPLHRPRTLVILELRLPHWSVLENSVS